LATETAAQVVLSDDVRRFAESVQRLIEGQPQHEHATPEKHAAALLFLGEQYLIEMKDPTGNGSPQAALMASVAAMLQMKRGMGLRLVAPVPGRH
jgi:hypothetical protein